MVVDRWYCGSGKLEVMLVSVRCGVCCEDAEYWFRVQGSPVFIRLADDAVALESLVHYSLVETAYKRLKR